MERQINKSDRAHIRKLIRVILKILNSKNSGIPLLMLESGLRIGDLDVE